MSISIGRGGISLSGGGVTPYGFSDDFGNPLGAGWLHEDTWSIVDGAAVNTPTAGSELLTNGNMETGDPPTGWATTGTISSVADERTGGAGAAALHLDSGASANRIAHQQATTVAGRWLLMDAWAKGVSHAGHVVRIFDSSFTDIALASVSTTDWTNRIIAVRATDTGPRAAVSTATVVGSTARADDFSLKELTLNTLFATRETGSTNINARVNVTLPQYTQGGVVVALDDATTPANFVIGYYDRGNSRVRLDKCVNGTWTNLINGTATYSAGAEVKIIKTGTTYQLYYATVQVGTDQTISDASIEGNTLHGMFSTGGGASLDAMFLEQP